MLTTIDENTNKINDNNKNKNPPIRVYYDFNVCVLNNGNGEREIEGTMRITCQS